MKSHALRRSAAVMVLAFSLLLAATTALPHAAFAQEDNALDQELAAMPANDAALVGDGACLTVETVLEDGLEQVGEQATGDPGSLQDDTQAADLNQGIDDAPVTPDGTDEQQDEDLQRYGGKADAGAVDTKATEEGDATNNAEADSPTNDEVTPTDLDLSTQAASTLDGVDISGWNPGVDLATLPGDFVIIKATEWNMSANSFTSYNTGLNGNYGSYIDQANAALAAGKQIGFYHFATNPNGERNSGGKSYVDQAVGFLEAVKDFIGRAVLCLDWENAEINGTVYSVVESDVTGAKQWLDCVYERTGIKPLIYMNKTCAGKYDWSSVKDAGYELWGAQYLYQYYPESGTINGYVDDPELRDGWGAWGSPLIYQYTSKASMPGSGGEIDVNKFYGTSNDWDRLTGSKELWVESGDSYSYVIDGVVQKSAWVVTPKAPSGERVGYQRYWLDANGKLAMGRVIASSEAGYQAYARPEGYVVRGAYAVGNKVYLADNDGRLAQAGWVVSDAYGHGVQRYWIDAQSSAAIVGYSATGGWDHYTRPEGYVARGMHTESNGYVYLADNEGKLEPTGWVISDRYGFGLQRYYVDTVAHACIPGYSEDGWRHYTLPEGFVVRGRYESPSGGIFVADNEGRLTAGRVLSDGWLVTADLGQGLQRYWVENGDITYNKLIRISDNEWAYARPEGYVVRGRYTAPNGHVYLANNEGILEGAGWLVSGDYEQGVQRYYIEEATHACVPGYSTNGWPHHTTEAGYVLRNASVAYGGTLYVADNDGRLIST